MNLHIPSLSLLGTFFPTQKWVTDSLNVYFAGSSPPCQLGLSWPAAPPPPPPPPPAPPPGLPLRRLLHRHPGRQAPLGDDRAARQPGEALLQDQLQVVLLPVAQPEVEKLCAWSTFPTLHFPKCKPEEHCFYNKIFFVTQCSLFWFPEEASSAPYRRTRPPASASPTRECCSKVNFFILQKFCCHYR